MSFLKELVFEIHVFFLFSQFGHLAKLVHIQLPDE